MRSTIICAAVGASVMCTAAAIAGPVNAAGPAASSAVAPTVTTPFALQATAFGTQARTASVPVTSSKTALVVVRCTREAGIDLSRGVETDNLAGLGTASGVATRAWTTRNAGVVTSHARSRIATLDVGDDSDGLTLEGLVVKTRSWHDNAGFHRAHSFKLAALSGRVGGIALPDLPLPGDIEPGETIPVPGVLTVTLDARTGYAGRHGASATSTGVVVELVDGSTVEAARAYTAITDKAVGGLLSGRAQSVRGSGLVDTRNVTKRTVPCEGTNGEWRNSSAAAFDQPGLMVGAANVGALGNQFGPDKSTARTRARTARLAIGGDEIVVTAIRSQANVVRDGDRYTRTPNGSSIGTLTIAGEQQELPDPGELLVVPGVAELTTQVVNRTARGIVVVGLRVELLGGPQAGEQIDISKSSAYINAR